LEECRYYFILAHELGYGQTESLMDTLEEASRLLNAYARAGFRLLTSGFNIRRISRGVSEVMLMYLLKERNQLG